MVHMRRMRLTRQNFTVIGVVLLFAATGVYFVVSSHAQTPTGSIQPEDGGIAGAASIVADSTASGNNAVKFGTSSSSGGGSALTSRPNDGTGYWPDFSNTGYKHTPANAGGLGLSAYPGSLTDYTSGMSASKYLDITYPNGSVIAFKHFLGSKFGINGDNLTFVGCLFEGTDPNDNLAQFYANTKLTMLYNTFKPNAYATPPGNNGTVSSSHTAPGTPYSQSWQLLTTMNDAVVNMDHNDVWGNAGMEMVTGKTGNPSTWTNNYIHDMADNDTSTFNGSSGTPYHHDGIGPQSDGNGGPMYINHNTIASLGNTNGLALQGSGIYDHITFTNNYVSGWGYAISIGVQNNATNITLTGNVFSTELKQLYGFLYGGFWGGTARGSTWRNNIVQVRSGDGNTSYPTSDNGKYYWPTDGNAHSTDYSG